MFPGRRFGQRVSRGNPIIALDHVIEEYRDYLQSEFRARDRALRGALEGELDRPLFLAQVPFYQALLALCSHFSSRQFCSIWNVA